MKNIGWKAQTRYLKWLGLCFLPVLFLLGCRVSETLPLLFSSITVETSHGALPTHPANSPAQKPSQPVEQNGYQPSGEITGMVDAVAMTAKARDIFLAARPVIDNDRGQFEKDCQTEVMKNKIELGCFTSNGRIYILRIDNDQLKSEMGVVAAHEMLHAAYAQLNPTDQTMINGELEQAIPSLQDSHLSQRLKLYRTLEPGQRDNELHSILGTEYAPLGMDLEQYYSLYFSDDRHSVLAASDQFNQVFTQKENDLSKLQAQIKQMRRQMQDDMTQHDNAAYNQLVPEVNQLIAQYNQAIKEYNSLSRQLMGQETPASDQ